MTDMKYEPRPSGASDSFYSMYFPLTTFWDVVITGFAIIAFINFVKVRNRTGIWMGAYCIVLALGVYFGRESLPVIGLLWNPRLLPMFNMCRYLLAGIGVIELVSFIVRYVQHERASRQAEVFVETHRVNTQLFNARSITAVVSAFVVLIVLGFRFQVLPFGNVKDEGQGAEYTWGPFEGDASSKGFVDGWARWNFAGYEGKSSYGEYYGVVQTMKTIGETRGCGRALWENFGGNDKYGTTMALMLLPFWTDGCIGSSEGLFFEAAGTTPYHFLAAGAMSQQSSNPVRELRYINNDAAVGVQYLQELGINYYLAVTPEAITKADEVAASGGGLKALETSGPWHIYSVENADIVVPLDTLPVVVNERSGDLRERWLELGTSWLQNRTEWDALPAANGPKEWQRIDVAIDMAVREGESGSDSRKVDVVKPVQEIVPAKVEPAVVSNVKIGDDSVSFTVDKVGVPVLVRVSYFPNWQVSGAKGPYRVAPNMMVVIPTSNQVSMHFKASFVDRFAYLLTIAGFVALFVMWRRDRRPEAATAAL